MKYDYLYEKIAQNHNITKEEVVREMQKSIEMAMNNPDYADKWEKIKKGKSTVTVDEFLEYFLTEEIKDLR